MSNGSRGCKWTFQIRTHCCIYVTEYFIIQVLIHEKTNIEHFCININTLIMYKIIQKLRNNMEFATNLCWNLFSKFLTCGCGGIYFPRDEEKSVLFFRFSSFECDKKKLKSTVFRFLFRLQEKLVRNSGPMPILISKFYFILILYWDFIKFGIYCN